MAANGYEEGGLGALIATKSGKKKNKSTKKKGASASQEKLQGVFNDPTAEEYALKPVESVEEEMEVEPAPDATGARRKEVREKGKLAKLRQKEKEETGNQTVFVGNIPITAQKKDLLKFFNKFGTIKSMRFRNLMRKDITKPMKASAIKKDVHPLSKSMNAYIVFEDEKSAVRALKRNGKELLGSHLRVDLASSVVNREPNRKCSVFVGNVPFDSHEEALREHFAACGDINNVRLIRDRETRLGKGFGYVEFKNTDGVALALQMNGQPFGKNKLRIQRCIKKGQVADKDQKRKDKSWSGAINKKGKSQRDASVRRQKRTGGEKPAARKPVKAKSPKAGRKFQKKSKAK